MAEVTLTLEEYEAMREMIQYGPSTHDLPPETIPKKRKASAYSKRYGKAFKKVSPDYKKKNGFKSAVRAAHKLAKSNRKL